MVSLPVPQSIVVGGQCAVFDDVFECVHFSGRKMCINYFTNIGVRQKMVETIACIGDNQTIASSWFKNAFDLLKVAYQVGLVLDRMT